MRQLALASVVALAGLASLAGCANHPVPKSTLVETTFVGKAPEAELPAQFKIVAFNVHMEPGKKIAPAIAKDPALRDADVIVMEEVHRSGLGCSGACFIGKQLGYHVLYAPGHAANDGDDGVAILSKAPILSSQVIVLPYFNVHVNSGRRVALAATIQQAGRPITVYAVHLDNRLDVDDRRTQMQPVLEHAKQQPTPVVIAGDFNTSPFTWVGHLLPFPTGTQDDNFERLLRGNGFDTPCADSGATHRYIGMKLDGIYTRGFTTNHFATSRASDVSDHMALWASMSGSPTPPAREQPASARRSVAAVH